MAHGMWGEIEIGEMSRTNKNKKMQPGTYGMWGALLAGGEVIYPTGYGTLETQVIVIC